MQVYHKDTAVCKFLQSLQKLLEGKVSETWLVSWQVHLGEVSGPLDGKQPSREEDVLLVTPQPLGETNAMKP